MRTAPDNTVNQQSPTALILASIVSIGATTQSAAMSAWANFDTNLTRANLIIAFISGLVGLAILLKKFWREYVHEFFKTRRASKLALEAERRRQIRNERHEQSASTDYPQ